MMIVRNGEYPPMIDEIDAVFKCRGLQVFYCWNDIIYNPMSVPVPAFIIAHEGVHRDQQRAIGVREWWLKYMSDVQFRFDQELPAHRAEYHALLGTLADNRNNRRRLLTFTAARLAAPLYGRMVTIAQAKKLIKEG